MALFNLSVATFNKHGFKSGFSQLVELGKGHDIIAVQEHWLREDEFHKFGLVNNDFQFNAVCGMKSVLSSQIMIGRPFCGTAFLWRRELNKYVSIIGSDSDGRCLAIKVNLPGGAVVIINGYFPCFERSPSYRDDISFYAGFIENILSSQLYSHVIMTGGMNFDIDIRNEGYLILKGLLDEFNLVACDVLDSEHKFTYFNEALHSASVIDHFFVSSNLFSAVSRYQVIDSGCNLSDHRPVSLEISLSHINSHSTLDG